MQTIEAIIFEPVGCLVDGARLYEDVIPTLSELKAMGIKLFITSSLSSVVEQHSLGEFFRPMDSASLDPEHTIFLTDSEAGLKQASSFGVSAILMMNDPDEAMRLAMREPAGGIVSLHELPDFIRFVAAENT